MPRLSPDDGAAQDIASAQPSSPPSETFVIDTQSGSFVVLVYELEPDLATLTRSELQVYQLVVDGCANEELAARRGVSKRTVRNQLMSIYRKLGVSSRRELKARFRLTSG
jgi:DNA-binding CsgD family transcriptional regulator